MNTKRTLLSEKEADLLDSLISGYGVIVSFDQVYSELAGSMSRQAARNLVSKLASNGWLVGIKKGLYFVAGSESRGFAALPVYKIAQLLGKDSYVSFEAALQHHGLFDQHLKTVISVSPRAYADKEFQGVIYKFVKAKERLYFGYEEKRVEDYLVKIATVEKALLDLLSFKRTAYSVDLVMERLRKNAGELDLERLSEYLGDQSLTVRRIMGFLLEAAGLDTEDLHAEVEGASSASFMLKGAGDFNARWRLYVPRRFVDRIGYAGV
jgi:predicted transcriptional regulator of viral defense system